MPSRRALRAPRATAPSRCARPADRKIRDRPCRPFTGVRAGGQDIGAKALDVDDRRRDRRAWELIMDLKDDTREISLIMVALGLTALCLAAADAAGAQSVSSQRRSRNAAPTDAFAQSRLMRPRTRIRVVPAYPYRLYSTTYPVPYKYEFPGPWRRAPMHLMACPGKPRERRRDRAEDALLVGALTRNQGSGVRRREAKRVILESGVRTQNAAPLIPVSLFPDPCYCHSRTSTKWPAIAAAAAIAGETRWVRPL